MQVLDKSIIITYVISSDCKEFLFDLEIIKNYLCNYCYILTRMNALKYSELE
jgi:hypothetical protein